MRDYIRIGVPSKEARETEIPATKVQEEYRFFRLSGYHSLKMVWDVNNELSG